jgi:arginyl-tRNA--protein-N-Asp/Glu arginylyltransferase
MKGYSMVCSKMGYKTQYYPLSHMMNSDIEVLLSVMENYGYVVELIKD